jgi:hypothetical protein
MRPRTEHTPPPLTTQELAAQCLVRADSIRVHLCRHGSYFGVRPLKLPNGRLAWPHDTVARLTAALAA